MNDGFRGRGEEVQEINENAETLGKISPAKNRFREKIWCFTIRTSRVWFLFSIGGFCEDERRKVTQWIKRLLSEKVDL